ncbi:hypothetical protein LJC58_00925 [Lachnospiraceae bacterium OttesenSCG-928-D06]|nr:hypothetical protein [Lachnospiraceae bacterium OttesenSCG-928-D06]
MGKKVEEKEIFPDGFIFEFPRIPENEHLFKRHFEPCKEDFEIAEYYNKGFMED